MSNEFSRLKNSIVEAYEAGSSRTQTGRSATACAPMADERARSAAIRSIDDKFFAFSLVVAAIYALSLIGCCISGVRVDEGTNAFLFLASAIIALGIIIVTCAKFCDILFPQDENFGIVLEAE